MNRLKPAKGVVYFLAFILIAIALVCQPNVGVTNAFYNSVQAGIILGTLFAVGAFANLFIGLTRQRWNVIWFSPFFVYTVMAWMLVLQGSAGLPVSTPISNTLLSALIGFELLEDWPTWKNSYR